MQGQLAWSLVQGTSWNGASYLCFQIKITSHLPVIMIKFSWDEFNSNQWLKMKLWHRKCQGITRGYTDVNLKTLETEGTPPALLPRQRWPNSFLLNVYLLCRKGDLGAVWEEVLLTFAPFQGPQVETGPKQPCCSRPHTAGGGRNANRTVAQMRRAARLPRKEHEYQTKWKGRLPNPRETCQF